MLTEGLKEKLLIAQKNEATEHVVYQRLSTIVRNKAHADVLQQISQEELAHYGYFKKVTGMDVAPDQARILFYVLVSRTLGLNFGLKLMERGEHLAAGDYQMMVAAMPQMGSIMEQEKKHERALIDLIDEDRLKYVSSVILGLNDALIELTATLAGFTLALQSTHLIGTLGLIAGIAAAMSMGVSEYLATKHDEEDKDPVKAGLYTGISYILSVFVLVLPYFLLTNIFVCLGLAIGLALVAILFFTYYTAVAQGLNFRQRFWEMAWMSLSIAAITFCLGFAARKYLGVSL